MTTSSLKEELLKELNSLPLEEQRKVLDFTRKLAMIKPLGVRGQELLSFVGTINKADLELMQQVIQRGCEGVDLNEW